MEKMTDIKISSLMFLLIAGMPHFVSAKGAGTSGGITLLEAPSARAASLGEAFSAVSDDIVAFHYNPSALQSLTEGRASLLYQRGLADDAYGQFAVGNPTRYGGFGLSVGYYNAGDIALFDGVTSRTVNAQTDMTMGLGYARRLGFLDWGVTAKYLTSRLVESFRAQAFAADFGLSLPVASRLRLGAAFQNIGSRLSYGDKGNDLPQIARLGAAVSMFTDKSTVLFLDAPYFVNEQELRPAVGLEIAFGVVSLRGGYKQGADDQEFAIGTGFLMGDSALDYSFGLADALQSSHRISFSLRFGQSPSNHVFVKLPTHKPNLERADVVTSETRPRVEPQAARYTLEGIKTKRRIYVVQSGDTLQSIAAKHYGNSEQWKFIYSANKHLIDSPTQIDTGQKIILP